METPLTTPSASAEAPGSGKAMASLVLGIIALFAWFIPLFGAPVAIVGLIMGIKGLKSAKRGRAITGIVLSIIGLILSIINAGIGAYLGATGQHPLVNQIVE